jgi:hypothetical protein
MMPRFLIPARGTKANDIPSGMPSLPRKDSLRAFAAHVWSRVCIIGSSRRRRPHACARAYPRSFFVVSLACFERSRALPRSSGANDAQRGHSASLPFYASSMIPAKVISSQSAPRVFPRLLKITHNGRRRRGRRRRREGRRASRSNTLRAFSCDSDKRTARQHWPASRGSLDERRSSAKRCDGDLEEQKGGSELGRILGWWMIRTTDEFDERKRWKCYLREIRKLSARTETMDSR